MPVTALYTTGIHEEVVTFDTDEERVSWNSGVQKIKAESAALFERREAEGLTPQIRALYVEWMKGIKAFKEAFGENRVPQDIKWALNTAEEGLGIEVTQWVVPPNREVFEN